MVTAKAWRSAPIATLTFHAPANGAPGPEAGVADAGPAGARTGRSLKRSAVSFTCPIAPTPIVPASVPSSLSVATITRSPAALPSVGVSVPPTSSRPPAYEPRKSTSPFHNMSVPVTVPPSCVSSMPTGMMCCPCSDTFHDPVTPAVPAGLPCAAAPDAPAISATAAAAAFHHVILMSMTRL